MNAAPSAVNEVVKAPLKKANAFWSWVTRATLAKSATAFAHTPCLSVIVKALYPLPH